MKVYHVYSKTWTEDCFGFDSADVDANVTLDVISSMYVIFPSNCMII